MISSVLIFATGVWIGSHYKSQIIGFKEKVVSAAQAAASQFKNR